MKGLLLLSLFFVVSCSGLPERRLASQELIILGNADHKNSLVKVFPMRQVTDHEHHFYLELRDTKKKLVDIDHDEIELKLKKENLEMKIERISLGKYEIQVHREIIDYSQLNFSVQGMGIKHTLVSPQKPDKKKSSVSIITNQNHIITLQINLKDKQGNVLVSQLPPEIILEGSGQLSPIEKLSPGKWEFSVQYPDENQIFYISVRANGVLLERVFRLQHIEK